jgi:D-serine deaminase-like pyridoxal phosphate-dependent protein
VPFKNIMTPALILDRAALQRNLDAMHSRMKSHGVALRPHLKTAKSAEIAKYAVAGQAGGITVSTLAEAEYFLGHGFRDILYAVGILPARLDRVAALAKAGADIKIITDSVETARQISERSSSDSTIFQLLIEIDSGEGRAGVLPDGPEFMGIAKIADTAPNMALKGVLTHAGHSYNARTIEEIRAVAEQERSKITGAAQRLRDAGLPCPIVSAGSTPTAVHTQNLEGVTEMRPGVFVFNDLKQLSIGACARENLALSVLASVIGHNRHKGHILLDTGALALSKDISAHDEHPEVGYGEVCDAESLESLNGLFVAAVSQEHGIVPVGDDTLFDRLPIGTQVRILPNHACITAAGYAHYDVLEDGKITAQWDRVNGW